MSSSSVIPPQTPSHLHHLHHTPRRAVDLRIPAIEKYAYCLCLHVKPTTIFVAVFKLIRALLFASLLLNTEFAINEQGPDIQGLSSLDDRHRSTAAAMSILSRIVMASVSAVGIYAVVSGRAALLMPLYAMLLCDFFFSLPAFYSRDIEFTDGHGYSDLKPPSPAGLGPNPHGLPYTRLSMILFSTIAMIIKIYFLCVVWKCYRYLRLIELVTPIRLSEIYPHLPPAGPHGYPVVRVLGSIDSTDLSSQGHNVTPPPYESVASSMKPPNYEEAIKSSPGGSVFAMHDSNSPHQQHQQQQPQPLPQQTMVFTIPSSEQYPTTQVIVTNGGGGVGANEAVASEGSSGVRAPPAPGYAGNPVGDDANTSCSSSVTIQETQQQQQQQQQLQQPAPEATNAGERETSSAGGEGPANRPATQ